ncbi:MAG: preprotein translocase subunit SecE [Bacteroidota bacterium]
MSKIRLFIIGSINEIRHKVTWPGYGELQRSSMLVLVASFVFAIIIGLVDLILKNTVSWFYRTF